jgi:hypothetical protein
MNFKPSGIKKYDESTNLAKWLKVYHLTIEATEGEGGLIHYDKLLTSLLIIIYQDLALRTSRRVSSFLESLMLAVHQ